MKNRDEKKRESKRLLDVLIEASKEVDSRKGVEEIVEASQVKILDKLINNDLDAEDRWVAYLQGFKASEIAKATGFTRANISARINHQVQGKKDEIDQKHNDNRERLYKARDWYLYVYLSDLEGDFRQIRRYIPKKVQNDAYMYRLYKSHGGEDLERDFVDRRHILEDERKEEIIKELKYKPLEQVSFQERVYPDNIRRIAEERGVKYYTEKEVGETEYTEKLQEWIKRKRELNILDRKRRKEREKKKESKEDGK